MVRDLGVPVESGPRVDVELPVGGVEHVGDAVGEEGSLVLRCVPSGKGDPGQLLISEGHECSTPS